MGENWQCNTTHRDFEQGNGCRRCLSNNSQNSSLAWEFCWSFHVFVKFKSYFENLGWNNLKRGVSWKLGTANSESNLIEIFSREIQIGLIKLYLSSSSGSDKRCSCWRKLKTSSASVKRKLRFSFEIESLSSDLFYENKAKTEYSFDLVFHVFNQKFSFFSRSSVIINNH